MPELLNIRCIYDKAPFSRKAVFELLSEAAAIWVRPPQTYAISKQNGEVVEEGIFSNTEFSLEKPTLEYQTLFVYSQTDSNQYRSVISIEEASGHAVYGLSFPISCLGNHSPDNLEKKFLRIFNAMNGIERCAILIGSEIDEPLPQPSSAAIERVFQVNTGVTWIIAGNKDVKNYPKTFEIVLDEGGVAILRQANFNLPTNKIT